MKNRTRIFTSHSLTHHEMIKRLADPLEFEWLRYNPATEEDDELIAETVIICDDATLFIMTQMLEAHDEALSVLTSGGVGPAMGEVMECFKPKANWAGMRDDWDRRNAD